MVDHQRQDVEAVRGWLARQPVCRLVLQFMESANHVRPPSLERLCRCFCAYSLGLFRLKNDQPWSVRPGLSDNFGDADDIAQLLTIGGGGVPSSLQLFRRRVDRLERDECGSLTSQEAPR